MGGYRVPACVALVLLLASCASAGTKLRPSGGEPGEAEGPFTVYFYGQRHYEDFNNFVILDVEGDGYWFSLGAIDSEYRTVAGLRGAEALGRAETFFERDRKVGRIVFRRIADPGGRLLGYELKPIYGAGSEGFGTLYFADYYLAEGGRVRVYFRSTAEPEARFGPWSAAGVPNTDDSVIICLTEQP